MGEPRASVSVHQAQPADVHACAALIARSLGDDDVLRAIIRGNDRVVRLIRLYEATMWSGPIQHGTVDVARLDHDGEIVGVAIWEGPDHDRPLSHPVQLFRQARAIGLRHLRAVASLLREFDAHLPDGPIWYLTDLAVDAGRQGLGIGSALLRHRLVTVDAGQLPAYLEATTEGSKRLYERHGFRHVSTVNPSGPASFAMVRPPVTTPA